MNCLPHPCIHPQVPPEPDAGPDCESGRGPGSSPYRSRGFPQGRRRRPPAAFTLIEILVVLAVLSLVLLFIQPNAARARADAETALLRQRAALLEAALAQYEGAVGAGTAADTWTATPTDEGRYALLRPFLAWPPPSLSAYSLPGHTIAFGPTHLDRITVTRDDGAVIYP